MQQIGLYQPLTSNIKHGNIHKDKKSGNSLHVHTDIKGQHQDPYNEMNEYNSVWFPYKDHNIFRPPTFGPKRAKFNRSWPHPFVSLKRDLIYRTSLYFLTDSFRNRVRNSVVSLNVYFVANGNFSYYIAFIIKGNSRYNMQL